MADVGCSALVPISLLLPRGRLDILSRNPKKKQPWRCPLGSQRGFVSQSTAKGLYLLLSHSIATGEG